MYASDEWRTPGGHRRSVIFYASAGIALQFVLLVGAAAFILVGATSQGSAITAAAAVSKLELANLAMQGSFLYSQQALRGYQITGEDRFLQSYYSDRFQYATTLKQARAQTWAAVLPGMERQADIAAAVFGLNDQIVAAPRGSPRAGRLFDAATTEADQYVRQNRRVQARLADIRSGLTTASQRSLGVGLGATAAALAVGVLLPVAAAVVLLRRSIVSLRATTHTVRRLAAGEHSARVVPSGPAETYDLASAINYLADENDRLRGVEEERRRLQAVMKDTAVRIREHIRAGAITREAVTELTERLICDRAWLVLWRDGKLELSEGNEVDSELAAVLARESRPVYEYADVASLYRKRSSRLVDLLSPAETVFPAELREVLVRAGGVYLLVVPFGTGEEPQGLLALLRDDPGRPWTPAEVTEIQSLAADIGRSLDHAWMYQEEEELVEQLRAVGRAKSSFVASASHDLQTPLTSIVGYVEMLMDGNLGPVTESQAMALASVERGTRRLRDLIEDMLTMSKIEMGVSGSRLVPVDLGQLVWAAAEAIRPAARGAGIRLEVARCQRGLLVNGDADQLDRVLANLLSNAVKYTPRDGTVTLAAATEGGMAAVHVTDTGIGIPEAEQASLFTPFFRASNAAMSSIPGSGLGLSIVGTIVRNHRGDIRVRSAEGEGTTVTVTIPLLVPGQRGPAGPGAGEPTESDAGGRR